MRLPIVVVLVIALSGCRTHLSLRNHTIQTASTIADLHYQQVVDNVARFVDVPSTVPSIAIVNNGTVTVTDQSTFGAAGTYAPTITAADQLGGFPIFSLFLNPNVSRGLTENWTLDPVTDNDKLRRLRCAFQYVVGQTSQDSGAADCSDCCQVIKDALGIESAAEFDCALPMNWYCCGSKKDVPKDACFVGRYRDRYVWVMPWGMEGLSRFTLTVLELASTDIKPHNRTIVRRYDSDNRLDETEITTIEPDEGNLHRSVSDSDSEEQSSSSKPAMNKVPKLHHNTPLSPKQQRRRPGTGSLMTPRL